MSNVVSKFNVSSMPYYILLQQAVSVRTLRELADCYVYGKDRRRRGLNRYECLGKIHREGLLSSVIDAIKGDANKNLYYRGRIILIHTRNVGADALMRGLASRLSDKNPPLRPADEKGLEFEIDRGRYVVSTEVDEGAALMIYEKGFMYSYRGSNLWAIPLTSKNEPTIRVGGREWLPLLLVHNSLRSINLGITLAESLNIRSATMRFTSYQPASIALLDKSMDTNGLEIRVYGPSTITRRVKTLTAAFSSILKYISKTIGVRDADVVTGYEIVNHVGPNKLARLLYERVKKRNGYAVMLRIKGMKYTIIAYGDRIGIDGRIEPTEVVAELLGCQSPEELFEKLEAMGNARIAFFSLKTPRPGLDLDLLAKNIPQEMFKTAIDSATLKYIGVNTENLTMVTFSSMSENRIRNEIREMLIEPLRDAILEQQYHIPVKAEAEVQQQT